ncbi:MAG: ribosome recycling factor [Microthrixaceae bacterium]|nr:ribosome recycling factor [Microthrixaceae bacterium]
MSDELADAIISDAADRMGKAVVHARAEFSGIRTGRANPGLFEKLPVEYYGSTVPMQQLAGFSVPDARMLMVNPFDKSSINAIERSIIDANLGLNPSNDGAAIRIAFPPLTEERRKEFVKLARARAEEGRNAVRSARRDARKDLESMQRDGDLSEDELHRYEKQLDDRTRVSESEIDDALEQKTAELMEA